jgi:hypothetical protein
MVDTEKENTGRERPGYSSLGTNNSQDLDVYACLKRADRNAIAMV